jgi:hypothetical protein
MLCRPFAHYTRITGYSEVTHALDGPVPANTDAAK